VTEAGLRHRDGPLHEHVVARAGMDPFPIVAVASSAGDLEAACELLSALPAECAVAVIVAQHLDSGRSKLLFESLAKRTILPVMHAHDGAVVEQRHVYLINANTKLTVHNGRIGATPNPGAPHHPADMLFCSLANDQGRGAIGVVLSGAGSDGTIGTQAIKRAGGITFAQYPGSARFPSMPISAIDTGCVEFVLRPNELARELARLRGYAPLANLGDDRDPLFRLGEPALQVPAASGPQRVPQLVSGGISTLPPI
jgi:two-component system, chemotaxis family, CheB/CheR fusion protein